MVNQYSPMSSYSAAGLVVKGDANPKEIQIPAFGMFARFNVFPDVVFSDIFGERAPADLEELRSPPGQPLAVERGPRRPTLRPHLSRITLASKATHQGSFWCRGE